LQNIDALIYLIRVGQIHTQIYTKILGNLKNKEVRL